MKISFYTLGCKLNQAETEYLKKDLKNLGFSVVPFETDEDFCVIRACGVTMGASQTTREMIRRAKRNGACVVALGCLENKDLPEIDFWAKSNKEAVEFLKEKAGEVEAVNTDEIEERTRGLVKIQTGCNFNCAYCIIPTFRGKSESISVNDIISKIKELEKEGFKEITLTGVNICQYDYEGNDLASLLENILKETDIPRIRLGSLDPRLITDKLIQIYSKEDRLLPHWHLSLQSGSDSVLKRMARGYTASKYFEIVEKLRKERPFFSFTTDIIVGFPGETDLEFEETIEFVKKVSFTKVHVFPYSKRPGTVASDMEDQVQDIIKKERVKKLIAETDRIADNYKKNFLGSKQKVLFEGKKDNLFLGYTPHYIRIGIESEENLENEILEIEIKKENLL